MVPKDLHDVTEKNKHKTMWGPVEVGRDEPKNIYAYVHGLWTQTTVWWGLGGGGKGGLWGTSVTLTTIKEKDVPR